MLTRTGRRITLLVCQFTVLVVCVGYIDYFYTSNIIPDKQVKTAFQQTDCFLISKQLTGRGRFFREHRADFYVSYNVNGAQYTRWVSGNGLDTAFTRDEWEQKVTLSQFEVGGTYTCWYDPDSPQVVVLVLRHNWISTFHLMAPSAIGVVTLYYLLKNLFGLISIVRADSLARKKHSSRSKKM